MPYFLTKLLMVQSTWNWYKHLSQEEREELFWFVREGLSYREIARRMWRSHSTLLREMQRNSVDVGWWKRKYSPIKAHQRYQERRYQANQRLIVLWRDHKQRSLLMWLLKEYGKRRWPDEIVWRLRNKGVRNIISTSTFYRFIRYDMPELQKYLT